MSYEVEQKFPVSDLGAVERRLLALGAQFEPSVEQVDRYFAHPSRDFAKTDEAFRIRRVGNENFITYKGPKLDAATKTRREIELPLAAGAEHLESFTRLLEALGFSIVAEVTKHRRSAEFVWRDRDVTASLDAVANVGSFVELEIISDKANLDDARTTLLALASKLDLAYPERRSYLELLLQTSGTNC
jgi:adenylate cyclase class 2